MRYNALDVDLKADRVASYQTANIKNLMEIVGSAGVSSPADITPDHLYHRVQGGAVKTYAEIYDFLEEGALLSDETRPKTWQRHWNRANPNRWS
jgi:hypothetical protein